MIDNERDCVCWMKTVSLCGCGWLLTHIAKKSLSIKVLIARACLTSDTHFHVVHFTEMISERTSRVSRRWPALLCGELLLIDHAMWNAFFSWKADLNNMHASSHDLDCDYTDFQMEIKFRSLPANRARRFSTSQPLTENSKALNWPQIVHAPSSRFGFHIDRLASAQFLSWWQVFSCDAITQPSKNTDMIKVGRVFCRKLEPESESEAPIFTLAVSMGLSRRVFRRTIFFFKNAIITMCGDVCNDPIFTILD